MSDTGVIAAIDPDIFAPWSDWDLTHELSPDDGGLTVYRDGNKRLQLADPVGGLDASKKYKITISGDDIEAFAFGGIWTGQQFTVDLANMLTHALASGTNEVTLERDIVPGSTVVARTKDGIDLEVVSVVGRVVTVAAHDDQWAYVGFRPRLTMLLADAWSARYQRNTSTNSNSIVLREA